LVSSGILGAAASVAYIVMHYVMEEPIVAYEPEAARRESAMDAA